MKEFFWKRQKYFSCFLCLSCFYLASAGTADSLLDEIELPSEETLISAKNPDKSWTLLRSEDADDRYLINFRNVSIIEYIRFISKITETNFIFDENELQFSVTIVSEDPITLKNIMSALIQTLRIHGLNLLEQDNSFIITGNKTVNQLPTVISGPVDEKDIAAPIITRVFRIKNANLTTIAGIIKPMMSAAALVDIYNETKQLIVTDISTNVEKIATLLAALDASQSPLEIEAYKAKHISSETLIDAAKQIVTPFAGSNPLLFVPQKETNTIFIVSTPNLIERTVEVMDDLDVETKELTKGQLTNEKVFLYTPQNKIPGEIIDELNQIAKDLESSSIPSYKLIRALKKVKSVKDSNSLLFITDAETFGKITDILKTLDTSPTTKSNFYIYKIQQTSQAQIENALLDLVKSLKKTTSDRALIDAIKSMKYIKETDSFIFTGTEDALKKLADLLPTFDAAAFPTSHYWLYSPQFMTGRELESAIMDIRKNLDSSGLSDQALLSTINSMKWLPATNTLIFTGDPKSIERIQAIVKFIDVDSFAASSKIFLYSPQNLSREELEKALDDLTEKLDHKNIGDRNLSSAIDHMTWIAESQSFLFKADPGTIERLQAYLKDIDTKAKGSTSSFFLYNLKYASGDQVRDSLDQVAKDLPTKDPKQNAIIKVIDEMTYLKETNSLLLKGNQDAIDAVKILIEQFDIPKAKPAASDKTDFFIYKPKHLNSVDLQAALKEMAKDLQSSGLVDQNLLQSIQTMRFVEATNSIVFTGTKESLEKTKEILELVDVPTVEEGQLAELAGQTFLIYKVKSVPIPQLMKLLKDVGGNLAKADAKSNRDVIKSIDTAKIIEETRSILFVGTPDTLEKLNGILKQLDTSGPVPVSVSVKPPTYVIYKPVHETGPELIELLQDFEENLAQSGVQEPGLFDAINNLKYIEKTGYILISGDQQSIEKVQELIKKFDIPGIETGVTNLSKLKTSFLVYKLRYHQGTEIQDALKLVAQNLSTSEGVDKALTTAINSLQWLKITNSLLATGSPEVLTQLRELIQNVDVPLRQVFIEVLIIETTLSDLQDFGLQWGGKIQYLTKFAGSTSNFPSAVPIPPISQPAVPLVPALGAVNATRFPLATDIPTNSQGASGGFDLGVIGDIIMHKGRSFISLASLVNALQADGEMVVVMNPKIIAQDNQVSNIFVGQNIPFAGSSFQQQGANVINSTNIEYRDVGVNMSITPILSTDDTITLDISNDISQQIVNTTGNPGGIQGLQTSHTTLSARVTVPNNHFVVLSGLIQDTKVRAKTGIPCLGGLPIIGAAFSETQRVDSKNNVIFFIRPTIIETVEQYREMTHFQECLYKEQSVKQVNKENIDAGIDMIKRPEDE